MDDQTRIGSKKEDLIHQLLETVHIVGEFQTKIVDDSISQTLTHNEGLLNLSESRDLDTHVLDHLDPEEKVEERKGSKSIIAHPLKKTSSPMSYEVPLLQGGSVIILFPPFLYVGLSAPSKVSETLLLTYERLALDQAKLEVVSDKVL